VEWEELNSWRSSAAQVKTGYVTGWVCRRVQVHQNIDSICTTLFDNFVQLYDLGFCCNNSSERKMKPVGGFRHQGVSV
jgi:hypothetical protein